MKKLLLASTSTIYGSGYLEYLLDEVKLFFAGVDQVVFIPYARPSGISHDEYTAIAQKAFATINIKIKGLHKFENPKEALKKAQGVFTGGGNTFLLLKQLYDNDLMALLKAQINIGTPYMGTSAGSNIAGQTVRTTNDMPIVYPPSFDALGLVNFNINPHYLDPNPNSTHKGETRETRILEYLTYNTIPVVGLREGSWLAVSADEVILKGKHKARVFIAKNTIKEVESGIDLMNILL
jgi:dipeptidase E